MVTHTYLQSRFSKDISKYTDPGYLVNLRCYRAFKWDCECGRSFVCRWRPVKTLPIAFLSHLDWYFSRLPPFFLSFSTSFCSKLPRNSQMREKWSVLTTVFEKGGRKRKSGFAALGKLDEISLEIVCAKSWNCWQSGWKYSNSLCELYVLAQRGKSEQVSGLTFYFKTCPQSSFLGNGKLHLKNMSKPCFAQLFMWFISQILIFSKNWSWLYFLFHSLEEDKFRSKLKLVV